MRPKHLIGQVLVLVVATALTATAAFAHTQTYSSYFGNSTSGAHAGDCNPGGQFPCHSIFTTVHSAKAGCYANRTVTLSKDGTQIRSKSTSQSGYVQFNVTVNAGHTWKFVALRKVLVNNAQHKHICSRHPYTFSFG